MNMSAEDLYQIREDETFDMSTRLLQPWSTPVMQTVLPRKILEMMIGLTDAMLELDSGRPFGHRLAGQIRQETLMDKQALAQAGLLGFFQNIVKVYAYQSLNQKFPWDSETIARDECKADITSMWIVSQFENEYNPVHTHESCDVSAVMYLKVPDMLDDIKDKKGGERENSIKKDGSITFVGNVSRDVKLSTPYLEVEPKVGDLYLFGAHQLHSVNPFRSVEESSQKERRSISFNATFEMTKKEPKHNGSVRISGKSSPTETNTSIS